MKKSKIATKPKKEQAPEGIAMHARDEHGEHHIVGLGLRVVIVPDGRFWFAQGLDIDYSAQGDSVDDVKVKFQNGLSATIYHHLRIFGNINKVLRVAPNEEWMVLWRTPRADQQWLSHVSMHQIAAATQYENTAFMVAGATAACE